MVSIKCVRGAGDREAPKITDELICDEHIGRLRGAAFLDEAYYDRQRRRVRAPYKHVSDGQVVRVSDPLIAVGNHHVRSVTVSIERPGKITMTLELEGDFEEPVPAA